MWRPRRIPLANQDARRWSKKTDFDKTAVAGTSGIVRRLGRAVPLRSLPDADYNRARKELKHYGPYLPVILEACREEEYSYEYRHGVQSYGAFTYALASVIRQQRAAQENVSWSRLMDLTAGKLHDLDYQQTPVLVCPDRVRRATVPLGKSGS